MNDLLKLPYELQIVLFAGYVGYQVATIGRAVVHKTEDTIFQVLAFGTLARLLMAAVLIVVTQWFPLWNPSETLRLVLVGFGTLFIVIAAAASWRSALSSRWSKFMSDLNVYRDDHESSTWRSILAARTKWTYVQLHCTDGRVFESNFDRLPIDLPSSSIILNDDGIGMYVTRFYRADGTKEDTAQSSKDYGLTFDYFPRANVSRIEIGWQKR